MIFGTGLTGTVGAPAGYIGIGKSNPTAMFDVAGDILVNGVSIGNGYGWYSTRV